MRNLHTTALIVLALAWCIAGCSADGTEGGITAPGLRNPDAFASGPISWGSWDIRIEPDGTAYATPLRHSDFAMNVVRLVDGPPSRLGLEVIDIHSGTGYTDIILDISFTHPFESATKFTGFDVFGVVMGDGEAAHPYDSSLLYSAQNSVQLLNADGYTRWMNQPEFSGTDPAILGYIPGASGSGGYAPTATLNPYKYFCDGLEAEADACAYLIANPANRGMFGAGSMNMRRYELRFPISSGFHFQYAVIARWQPNVNSPDPPVNVPDDFPIAANARESVLISLTNDTSDMWWSGSTGGGDFIADITVLNRHAQPGASDIVDDYEINLYSDAWTGAQNPDMTATSHGSNYCVFHADIPATPARSGALDVWISVAHPGLTYANPFGVPTGADSSTLAAHFQYEADVDYTGTSWEPPTDRDPRFLFIHHSTGEGFLYQGGMWDMLVAAGFDVHDRTYGDGWVGDNTDPEHWPITFTEYYDDMISWELAAGEYYDIVAFKSCFPASYIDSDEMLEDYKGYYNTVKTVTEQHPETLFVPFTFPPLVPNATEPEIAARAREFANWLKDEYDEGEANMVVYDVFDILAGDNPLSGDYNCLRYEYQVSPDNSHPNALANETVAADFTAWLVNVVWD